MSPAPASYFFLSAISILRRGHPRLISCARISSLPSSLGKRTNDRTFDEYKSELASGHLTWSPTHKNDDFWRDNASKLTDKDREQLKWVLLSSALQFPSCRAVADTLFLTQLTGSWFTC